MARRSRAGRGFVRPAPRTKMWIGGINAAVTLPASTVVLMATLSAAALLLRPFTILRYRAAIHYENDQQVTSERSTGAMGFMVVNDTAAALGITGIPSPITNPDAPWFVWQGMTNRLRLATAVGFDANGGTHYEVDSKAMRKIGPNEDLAVVFDEQSAVGAVLQEQGRILIQLH